MEALKIVQYRKSALVLYRWVKRNLKGRNFMEVKDGEIIIPIPEYHQLTNESLKLYYRIVAMNIYYLHLNGQGENLYAMMRYCLEELYRSDDGPSRLNLFNPALLLDSHVPPDLNDYGYRYHTEDMKRYLLARRTEGLLLMRWETYVDFSKPFKEVMQDVKMISPAYQANKNHYMEASRVLH